MILVVAEQRDGKLNRATLETIAAAQALAGSDPIKAVVLGQSVAAVAQELADAVSEVLLAEHAMLAAYTPDAFATAVQQVVASAKPTYVLFPHTYQTRDFAPVAALRMGGGFLKYRGGDATLTQSILAAGGEAANPNGGSAGFHIVSGTTLTIPSGGVSGFGGILKDGTGVLKLTGTNTYSGATIISGGALAIDNPAALGTNDTV